ncbi:MAG: hypothetical protein ABDH49_08035 [Candidatus Hydrothermales bacterium]
MGEIYSPILSKRFVNDNFAYFYNQVNFFVGDTFFVISYNEPHSILCSLNSSCGALFAEIIGRKSMGEGVLLMYGSEISNLLVLHPNLIRVDKILLQSMLNRNFFPIFKELGFDPTRPICEQEPNPLPDRKALDDIVFDALGLTEEERKEVYWAVAELVNNRLEKAKSV